MSERDDGAAFVLARSPSHLLHRAQQFAADHFSASMAAQKVTLRQFAVLAAIAARASQTQTDLVKATGIDRSTLADMITRMEQGGLVARDRAVNDARAKAVKLTAAGRATLAAATPRAKAADDALLAALPQTKRRALVDALFSLAEAADAMAPPEPEPVVEPKRRGRPPAAAKPTKPATPKAPKPAAKRGRAAKPVAGKAKKKAPPPARRRRGA